MRVELIGPVPLDMKAIAEKIGAETDFEWGYFLAYGMVVEEHDPEDDFPPGHVCSIVIEMVDRADAVPSDECEHREREREERIAAIDPEIRNRALGIVI